jgi:hypothetical protein
MATLKNTTINDTGHITVASGTTAQRPASPAVGMVRYNTTLSVLEQYTDVGWQGIEAPPVVSSISPTSYSGNAGSTITINGSNFKSGSVVSFVAQSGAATTASSTTFVSSSQLTAVTPIDYTISQGPLGISVANPSGLAARLENALSTGSAPSWTTGAGNIWDNADDTAVNVTVVATDSESGGGIASYSIVSGSLPGGVSLNTSTGAITGTPSVTVTSATTYSFTLGATDNAGNRTDRAFTIILRNSKLTSATAFPTSGANYNLFTTGWTASSTDLNNLNHASSTFRIPANVYQLRVVVWGGGSAMYNTPSTNNAGGYADAIFRVTPQEYYKVIVANAGSVVNDNGGNGGSGIGGGSSQDGNDVGSGGGGSGFFYAANTGGTAVSSEATMFSKGVLIAGGAGALSGQAGGSGNAGGTSSVTIAGIAGIGAAGGNGGPHSNSNGGLANGGGGAVINQSGTIVASSPARGASGGYADDGHGNNCGGGTGGGSGAGGTGGGCSFVNPRNAEGPSGDGGRGCSNYTGNLNSSGPGLGGIDSNGNSTGGNGFRFNSINLGGGGGGGHGASNAGGGWGGGGTAYYSYAGGGGSGGAWGYLSGTTPALSGRVAPGSVSVNGGNANSVCGVPTTAGESRTNIGTGNGHNGAVLIMW